jgi:hypothetical protein
VRENSNVGSVLFLSVYSCSFCLGRQQQEEGKGKGSAGGRVGRPTGGAAQGQGGAQGQGRRGCQCTLPGLGAGEKKQGAGHLEEIDQEGPGRSGRRRARRQRTGRGRRRSGAGQGGAAVLGSRVRSSWAAAQEGKVTHRGLGPAAATGAPGRERGNREKGDRTIYRNLELWDLAG